ncbi:attH component of attEFGH ABC transport system [Vibrio ishigakensis]|uniref:AttH component of attEFGH ABC transport system n=1 Tax=Vibrio ishigakensis TaxID=1481914 RepID=A0A0B8NXC8_9VIBR|nr:lipocalin-like domain-containing protein [Vibrio ishigakensis]GAM56917.1 attH component of attEFGH ABC transport system [Vibrio ishigakensis]
MFKKLFNRTLAVLLTLLVSVVLILAGIYVIWYSDNTADLTIENLEPTNEAVFEPVLPGVAVKFPQDFRIHSKFRYEVWTYVAMLNDEQGNEYMAQWYLYRTATSESDKSGWQSPQIYASQVVLSTPDQIFSEQRFARGGIGLVGMRARPYQLSIDNWVWRSFSSYPAPGQLSVSTDDFNLKLKLRQDGPYVPMGDNGYQVTNQLLSRAIYGYQSPYIRTQGTVEIDGKTVKLSGMGWLNQVWGSEAAPSDKQVYTRFQYRFNDGRVMYLTRVDFESGQPHVYGAIMSKTGVVHTLNTSDVELYPVGTSTLSNGKLLQLQWVVNVPKFKIFLTSDAHRREQWVDLAIPSWSGSVRASGSENARGFMQIIEQ